MLIEYRIKFEKDGLTIAQHIEPNSTPVVYAGANKVPVSGLPATRLEVRALAATNPLAKLPAGVGGDPIGGLGGDPIGGLGGDPIGGLGGGVPGSAPIFILGPIVFGGSVPYERRDSTEPIKTEVQPLAASAAVGKSA